MAGGVGCGVGWDFVKCLSYYLNISCCGVGGRFDCLGRFLIRGGGGAGDSCFAC